MHYEIRYADSGVVPEGYEPAVREWQPDAAARRPDAAARRLEISHEWPPRPAAIAHQNGDPYAGYEDYAGYRTR